jgi:hypothetical protein
LGDRRQAGKDLGRALLGLGLVLGVEDLPEGGADEAALVPPDVLVHVADGVDRAALPRAGQDAGDRGLQSLVRVGDDELDTVQATPLERQQELAPERARLDLADIQVEHLENPALMDGVGEHDRLGDDTAAGLRDLDPQLTLGRLQVPGTKPVALPRRPLRPTLVTGTTQPRVELVLDRPLNDQPSTEPGELGKHLLRILDTTPRQQLVDARLSADGSTVRLTA